MLLKSISCLFWFHLNSYLRLNSVPFILVATSVVIFLLGQQVLYILLDGAEPFD